MGKVVEFRGRQGVSRVGAEAGAGSDKPCSGEVDALGEALALAMEGLRAAESNAEVARLGGVVARLCDSIGRAKLAAQKLSSENGDAENIYTRFEQALREMGRGER